MVERQVILRPKTVTAQSAASAVIYLNQGWSPEIREAYLHISQGSTVMPYDIFLNLEVADSQELFRLDANGERYGLISEAAAPQWTPDGLSVGLSKTVTTKGPGKGEDVGLTCAACHEAKLHYQDNRIRIEGGVANTFDIEAYLGALDDALQTTLQTQRSSIVWLRGSAGRVQKPRANCANA